MLIGLVVFTLGVKGQNIIKGGNMLDVYGYEANPSPELHIVGCGTCPNLKLNVKTRINEQQAMKKTHIDLTKEYVFFNISGLIEIDGHTFLNDTCKSPIVFEATLDGVTIINPKTREKYTHRICEVKGCNIIHLIQYNVTLTSPEYNHGWGIQLLNGRLTPTRGGTSIIDTMSTTRLYKIK